MVVVDNVTYDIDFDISDAEKNASKIDDMIDNIWKDAEDVEVDIDWDTDELRKKLSEIPKFAKDTWDKIDPIEFKFKQESLAKAQVALDEIREDLKNAKKEWEDTIDLRIEQRAAQRNVTELKRELNNLQNTWDSTVSRLQRKFDWLWSWLISRFKKIAWVIVATFSIRAIWSFFTDATNAAAKFQQRMSDISTLITWDATWAIDELSSWIKELTKTIPKSADDLWASAYSIVSAGISDTADALNVLESAWQLAVWWLSTTAQATDILTSAINAFWFDASESQKVSDILFKTVKNGKTDIAQLSQSFGANAPVIAAAWISLEEFSAATAALTTTWLPASQAQTQLRAATVALIKPTTEMKKLLKESWFETWEAAIKSLWLVWTLEALDVAANWNTESLWKALWSSEALGAAQSLLWEQWEAYATTLKNITQESNALDEAFLKQSETFESQRELFNNNIELLKIWLWEALLPIINTLFEALTPLVEKFTEFTDQNPEVFVAIWDALSIVWDAVATFLWYLFDAWSTVVDFFDSFWVWADTLSTWLSGAIWFLTDFWDTVSNILWFVWDLFVQAFDVINAKFGNELRALFDWVSTFLSWVFDFIWLLVLWAKTAFEANFLWIQTITQVVFWTIRDIISWIMTVLSGIIEWWLNVLSWLFTFFGSLVTWNVSWMWEGIKRVFWWLFQALSWVVWWWLKAIWSLFTNTFQWLVTQASRRWVNIVQSFADWVTRKVAAVATAITKVADKVKAILWVESPTLEWPLSIDQSIRWENLMWEFAKWIDKWQKEVKSRILSLTNFIEEELSKDFPDLDLVKDAEWKIKELEWALKKWISFKDARWIALDFVKKQYDDLLKLESDQIKQEEQLRKKQEKWRETIRKKVDERRIKELEENWLAEIQAINSSELAVSEKAKRIKEIEQKLAKDIKTIKWRWIRWEIDAIKDWIKEQEDELKKAWKTAKNVYENVFVDWIKESQDAVDDLTDDLKKQKTEVEKINEEIKKVNTSFDEKISDLESSTTDSLLNRFVDVRNEIDNLETAELDEWEERDTSKIAQLKEELQLIKDSTTEEQRKEQLRVEWLNETQKILENRTIELEQIELSRQAELSKLEAERLAIEENISTKQRQLEIENTWLENLKNKELEFINKIDKAYWESFLKRKALRDEEIRAIQQVQALARWIPNANTSWVASATTNNQSTLNIWNVNVEANDGDDLIQQLLSISNNQ